MILRMTWEMMRLRRCVEEASGESSIEEEVEQESEAFSQRYDVNAGFD